jgi:hypothetical protein
MTGVDKRATSLSRKPSSFCRETHEKPYFERTGGEAFGVRAAPKCSDCLNLFYREYNQSLEGGSKLCSLHAFPYSRTFACGDCIQSILITRTRSLKARCSITDQTTIRNAAALLCRPFRAHRCRSRISQGSARHLRWRRSTLG